MVATREKAPDGEGPPRIYAVTLVDYGYELLLNGDFGAAARACDRALDFFPEQGRAWSLKSFALVYRGREGEAVRAADEAVRRDPASGLAFAARGAARALAGELAGGAEDCEYALALTPACPYANYFSACCWARLEREELAAERLVRAVAVDGRWGERARAEAAFRPYRGESWFAALTGPL